MYLKHNKTRQTIEAAIYRPMRRAAEVATVLSMRNPTWNATKWTASMAEKYQMACNQAINKAKEKAHGSKP
jgi:hypothetical protein